MNPIHIIIAALDLNRVVKEPISKRRMVFLILLPIVGPFLLIVPLLVMDLGDWSGIGWIALVSKFCAVLVFVGMILWVIRKLEA